MASISVRRLFLYVLEHRGDVIGGFAADNSGCLIGIVHNLDSFRPGNPHCLVNGGFHRSSMPGRVSSSPFLQSRVAVRALMPTLIKSFAQILVRILSVECTCRPPAAKTAWVFSRSYACSSSGAEETEIGNPAAGMANVAAPKQGRPFRGGAEGGAWPRPDAPA